MFDAIVDFFTDADWRTVSLVLCAVGQVVYVGVYATFPWFRTYLGRSLFFKALMLSMVIAFASYARVTGQLGDTAFTVMYTALGAGIWAQTIALLRVRAKGIREDRAEAQRKAAEVEGIETPVEKVEP